MEKKIEDRIELYSTIYLKAFEKALKVNSNNARYIASEIFKEIARDLRSELISKLQRENGKSAEIKREDAEENGANTNGGNLREENTGPATDKQRHALHKFGLKNLPEYLTKKAASEILGILIHHLKEGDNEAIASLVGKFNSELAEVNGNNSSLK